jgi:hypothetical protein
MLLLKPKFDTFLFCMAESAVRSHKLSWHGTGEINIFLFREHCFRLQKYFSFSDMPPECWNVLCPSTQIVMILRLKFGNQLQLKSDLQQNTFWSLTLESKVNLLKCVEILKHNAEIQTSALSHFRPKVEIWSSNTHVTRFLFGFWVSQGGECKYVYFGFPVCHTVQSGNMYLPNYSVSDPRKV